MKQNLKINTQIKKALSLFLTILMIMTLMPYGIAPNVYAETFSSATDVWKAIELSNEKRTEHYKQYSLLSYKYSPDDVIKIAESHWRVVNVASGSSNSDPYAGAIIYYFDNDKLSANIESVTFIADPPVVPLARKKVFTKSPVGNTFIWHTKQTDTVFLGPVGANYNANIEVKLKDGQTLVSLGLENTPITMYQVWTDKDRKIVTNGENSTIIFNKALVSPDNEELFKFPKATNQPPKAYLKYDSSSKTLKVIHQLKFTDAVGISTTNDSGKPAVFYVNEKLPEAITNLFDNTSGGADAILYRSDDKGEKFSSDTPVYDLNFEDDTYSPGWVGRK